MFLEDVGEPHYRIDRYLTQLLNSGVLAKVSGIVLGVWEDCGLVKGEKDSLRSRRALDAIFLERLGGLRVPMLSGLPFGHGIENGING